MRLPVPLNEESNADLVSEIKKEIFLGIRWVLLLWKSWILEIGMLIPLIQRNVYFWWIFWCQQWRRYNLYKLERGKISRLGINLSRQSQNFLVRFMVRWSLEKFSTGLMNYLLCLITIWDWRHLFILTLKWRLDILNLIAIQDMLFWLQMDNGEQNEIEIENFGSSAYRKK